MASHHLSSSIQSILNISYVQISFGPIQLAAYSEGSASLPGGRVEGGQRIAHQYNTRAPNLVSYDLTHKYMDTAFNPTIESPLQ